MRTFALLLAGFAIGVTASAHAQSPLYGSSSALGGVQVQNYSFRQGYRQDGAMSVRQFAFPLGVVLPLGQRFSLDIGSQFARTEVRFFSGPKSSYNGLTDTQVRASYVFGKDAVVATLMLNLPTGKSQDSASRQAIASSASASFLSFPVNTYGNGFSATSGLAVARQLGEWNIGLAGSVRVSANYHPFTGDTLTYRPGAEVRLRLGVDRLLGSSRFNLGFTYSTFGDDKFTQLSTGTGTGAYSPGGRLIGEASVTAPVGSSTVTGYLWDYFRGSSDASNPATDNRENILALGATGNVPLGGGVTLLPVLETRFWSPKLFDPAYLVGAGAAVRFNVAPRLSFAPGARFDLGAGKSAGAYRRITGWGMTGLFRYDF
jgi:hypothetical protein